jgi:hypothetical protein
VGCIWQNGREWDIREICQMIVKRFNDVERQAKTEMREKILTCILEEEWGTELYTSSYELN